MMSPITDSNSPTPTIEGGVIQSKVRATVVQLKREAKLTTTIVLTIMHAVCRIALML